MPVYEFKGLRPTFGRDVFVADTAAVAGDVQVGDRSSIWFGAVVRGDCYPIRIGSRSNLQDNVLVHVLGGKAQAIIGDEVTVGTAYGGTSGRRARRIELRVSDLAHPLTAVITGVL